MPKFAQNSTDYLDNATFIIRSAHERTEGLCKRLISEQGVPEEDIHLVHEVPFSASMRKSFEIGLEESLRWTFCVDADVLLRPGSIEQMIESAEQMPGNVCEVQGYIIDKFFGGPRPGGVHLYRTSLLPKVIQSIPEEGENIRPEFHTLNKMQKDGYPWKKIPYVTGTHDDEQYNFDIYRKAFVHGVKHLDNASLFVNVWRDQMEDDPDFRVAIYAFIDSIENRQDTYINRELSLYKKLFEESGFEEKPELDPELYSLDDIESRVANWEEHPHYLKKYPERFGLDKTPLIPKDNYLKKIRKRIRSHGFGRTLALIGGQLSILIGKKLNRIGDP